MNDDPKEFQRARFETWYAEHMSKHVRSIEPYEIKSLREDNHYGLSRGYLNGCWEGWHARGDFCD